ncbi:hypothetical protein Noda2021_00800 [Candidatus Dependentiae bacterium Noda2021]|nr:hypothetical protein Noda2021_00800 [Candidatus Dependentiae bacterium Noda2021]
MKKTIMTLLILSATSYSYDKVCRQINPLARYAHPFKGLTIDYQINLGINEETNHPTICYVHLTLEDKKILWQKLHTIQDKAITKELVESFSNDSVVSKVLADFKTKHKHESSAVSHKITVGHVINTLNLSDLVYSGKES